MVANIRDGADTPFTASYTKVGEEWGIGIPAAAEPTPGMVVIAETRNGRRDQVTLGAQVKTANWMEGPVVIFEFEA